MMTEGHLIGPIEKGVPLPKRPGGNGRTTPNRFPSLRYPWKHMEVTLDAPIPTLPDNAGIWFNG